MSDVIIIGGGPAGSALGCYLSMAGISNTIFEGDIHPRPHIGESLITASTRVFKEIGFLETMDSEGFVRKYGSTWHAPANKGRISIEYCEFPQKGIEQPFTYHVDRSRFDALLLKHANQLGSKVYQGVRVKEVLFEEGRACGVRVQIGDKELDVPARVVVDASGRNTLLGGQLNLKKKDKIFKQRAVHAWFEDVDRGSNPTSEHIHIYFLPVDRGWAWQIPITDKITSIGVVAEKEVFKNDRLDIENYFRTLIRSNENLAQAMRMARRINEFKSEGDYNYSMSRFVGDGFLLIGDAARFVDPIFSSGVSIALYSAKFAAECIQHAFAIRDFSAWVFEPYELKLRSGVDTWYEFIRLYYKLLPLFTYFINSKKYRFQILQLLQGEVFDRPEVPVLEVMRKFVKTMETSENHLFKARLTDIPIDAIPDDLLDPQPEFSLSGRSLNIA